MIPPLLGIKRMLTLGHNTTASLFPFSDSESGSQSAFNLIFARINQAGPPRRLLPCAAAGRLLVPRTRRRQTDGRAALSLNKYQYPGREPHSAALYVSSPRRQNKSGSREGGGGREGERENSIRRRPSSSDFSYLPSAQVCSFKCQP